MLGVLLMLAQLSSAASAPPDSAQFSGRVARLQQQVAELQQQLQRLQEHADPQRLPQRVIALEDELAKLQREFAQLDQLEDKLRRDLPWELLDRLTLFGSALAVVLTVVLALVGYLVTKQFIYQYLKDNALTEKLMQQALPQIIQDAGPLVLEKSVPQVVERITPEAATIATNRVMDYVGNYLRSNLPSGAAAARAGEKTQGQAALGYVSGSAKVTIQFGDITTLHTDVIVSSDDTQVRMAGNVAKRILEVGGSEILEEAQAKVREKPPEMGGVIITKAGKLHARFVYHPAVIDIATGAYPDEAVIATAVQNCLKKAEEQKVRSIAFPALGTGTAGLPVKRAMATIAQEVKRFLKGRTSLAEIVLVIYRKEHLEEEAQVFFDKIFV